MPADVRVSSTRGGARDGDPTLLDQTKGPYPLTAAQRSYADVCMPGLENSSWCNVQVVLELNARVRACEVHSAIAAVASRQQALLAFFAPQQGRLVQYVASVGHLDRLLNIDLDDLSHLTPDPAERAVERLRSAMMAAPVSPFSFPVFRARVVRLPHVTLVMTVFHHLVMDGYSTTIFAAELKEALAGRPLQPPELSYEDYLRTPAARSRDNREDVLYWRAALGGSEPFRISSAPSEAGSATFTLPFDAETRAGLKLLRTHSRCSDFVAVTAAAAKALGQALEREELLVLVPVLGRDRHEVLELIGNFFKVIPLRFRGVPAASFSQLLSEAAAQMSEGMDHLTMPLSELLEAVECPIDRHFHPLSTVLFNQDASPNPAPSAPAHRHGGRLVRYELQLFVMYWTDGVGLEISYRPSVLTSAVIEELANIVSSLIRQAASQLSEQTI